MFGSADFRIGDGLTIRRSRRLDFVDIPGRDQDEVASRPPGRDQARSGCPAEVVRQRVRLFSCRNTGYARGRSGWRRAAGKPSPSSIFTRVRNRDRSLATWDGESVSAPKCLQEATSSSACCRWVT
jgi:hypothetical protein